MMKTKYFIIVLLYNVFSVVLTSNVIIKWLTNDSFTDNVRLTRTFTPKTKFNCEWWKLVENKKIRETGEEFIYGDSPKDCSLIIVEFDFKKDHLDVYKAIDTFNRKFDESPLFVIAYLKSFELLKKQKSESIYEYSCELKMLFPNFAESLAQDIYESLRKILIVNGQERGNSKSKGKSAQKEDSTFYTIKDVFKKKPKREIGANEITLESDKVDVFVSGKNPSIFECSIQLIDQLNKNIVFSNSTIDVLNFSISSSKSLNANYLNLYIFLLNILFK